VGDCGNKTVLTLHKGHKAEISVSYKTGSNYFTPLFHQLSSERSCRRHR